MSRENIQEITANGMSIQLGYHIGSHSVLNYLLEYSIYLIKNKIYDGKLIKWQSQNIKLLNRYFHQRHKEGVDQGFYEPTHQDLEDYIGK
jgi:hypothetical protein